MNISIPFDRYYVDSNHGKVVHINGKVYENLNVFFFFAQTIELDNSCISS